MIRTLFIVIVLGLSLAGCAGTPATPVEALPSPTLTSTPFPTATPNPTPVPGILYVDPSLDLGPISPYIFGSNTGPWAVIPFGMFEQAFSSGVTALRFPGGEWGDQNDVTPLQIDQFISICRKMGALPTISVRLRSGTPEKAAALVNYVNIRKGYGVRYWSIGNEPDIYAPALKEVYDSARLDKEWRAIAVAMKAVDPAILLMGPEFHQYSNEVGDTNYGAPDEVDSAGLNWVDEFLKSNGDLLDVYSFHRYPFPVSQRSAPPSIADLRDNAPDWNEYFGPLRERIHTLTGRDLPLAVTEFSTAYNKPVGGEATPETNYHAIWLADVLGRMIGQNVFMANYWLLSSYGSGGETGLIGYGQVRPSYHVYQMYKMFGNERVYSSSDDPDLSIYASKRADGSLTVIVINLSLEARNRAITIQGRKGPQAEAWRLDPEHKAGQIGAVDLSVAVDAPPQSMTLFIIAPEENP